MTIPETRHPPGPNARPADREHVLRFAGTWGALDGAARALRQILEASGVSPRHLHDVALAFDEIATNIVKYGQPKEDVELVVRLGDETILTFEDDGVAFDPRGQAAPPVPARRRDLRIGGLGLVLIRHFSSHIDYTRTPDHRNRLTVAIPPRR